MTAAHPLPFTSEPAHAGLGPVSLMPEPVVSLDAEGRVLDWNAQATVVFGYTAEEARGRPLVELLIPEPHRARFESHLPAYLQRREQGDRMKVDARSRDGRDVPVEAIVVGVPSTQAALQLCLIDRSARLATERRLRDALGHHALLLRSLKALIVSVDAAGVVQEWNTAAEEVLGLGAERAIGVPFVDLPLDWDWRRVRDALAQVRAGVELRLDDIPFRTSDQRSRVLGLALTGMTGDDRVLAGVLVTGADITQRRELERQVQQAQRLESIGRLAAGIAHEINTPIQFVGDNLRFLKDGFQDLARLVRAQADLLEAVAEGRHTPERVAEVKALAEELELDYLEDEIPRAIDQSTDGAGRVARIVRAMKELSHPESKARAPADLNRALETTVTISRNEWKYVAEVQLDLAPDLPAVTCLINELQQAFLNMMVNAAHALQDSGKVDGDLGHITLRTREHGEDVLIEIEDDGCGMTSEVQARCFDPFYTTKEVGRGTGQGLALVHAVVVEQHGGRIDVRSAPGEGTTFSLWIPVATVHEAVA